MWCWGGGTLKGPRLWLVLGLEPQLVGPAPVGPRLTASTYSGGRVLLAEKQGRGLAPEAPPSEKFLKDSIPLTLRFFRLIVLMAQLNNSSVLPSIPPPIYPSIHPPTHPSFFPSTAHLSITNLLHSYIQAFIQQTPHSAWLCARKTLGT